MEISIRNARLEDYEAISNLYIGLHELHVEKRPEYYKNANEIISFEDFEGCLLSDSIEVFVAVDESESVIGFVEFKIINNSESLVVKRKSILYMNALVVDENHRKKGIAKRLFNSIIEYGKKKSVNAVELNVWAFNRGAIDFYQEMNMEVKNIRYEMLI